MNAKQNLRDQQRKLEEVRMWLLYRIGAEGDRSVRDEMFEVFRLTSLAGICLETVNYMSNGEYNDSSSDRQLPVDNPPCGFAKKTV